MLLIRTIKSILFIMCVIGLLVIPMSNIFFYDESGTSIATDFGRVISENAEHTDYHSSDISTFVNDYFIFYVPPGINRELEYISAYRENYRQYIYANLSTIQLFSYENGANIKLEWLNGTAINGTEIINGYWSIHNQANIEWLENIDGPKNLTKKLYLNEYETHEIQVNTWLVSDSNRKDDADDYRILSGVVKITSDYPISVMHHRQPPTDAKDDNGYSMINEDWDSVYSAYGKKLFTRITGDCWISALEAATTINVWDYSDKNDDIELQLDRFEGWGYSRNSIFEQYGFDDDLVLISADKPISIVAGMQSDQCFVQIFGKDGRDFHFPCFGNVLIHAPEGAQNIDIEDPNGNQGSKKDVSMAKGEMRIFDFKVAYKQRRYSSFEWATIRSSDPILVYTFVNRTWYLNEDYYGSISGQEYINNYKKTTQIYEHGIVPYPADTEFKLPLRSRAFITIVNLDESGNDLDVDFKKLKMPYKGKLDSFESLTLDFSKESYYPMDLINRDTENVEASTWLTRDPDNRYTFDFIPRISVNSRNLDYSPDIESIELIDKLSWSNITKGSTVTIKSKHPVLVMIDYDNYNRYNNYRQDDLRNYYQGRYPQGVDLIPGLTPPTYRGIPEVQTMIVIISGFLIAVDMIVVTLGRRSMAEIF